MRINRIKVDRHGPLENLDLKLNSGINVIYGSNESGKSLTMDFLLKKLSKKRMAKYKRMDRVQEEPEGFIVFYDNEERKLEHNQCLTDFLPSVKDEDICSIFVMKDSDLNIPDNKYYTSITDRLTGLRTEDIDKISKEILEFGFLTQTSRELLNNNKSKYLKDKIEDSKNLKSEISKYIEEKENDNLHLIEGEIFSKKMKIKQHEADLEKQKKLKAKDKYEENKNAIERIKSSKKRLNELPEESSLNSIKLEIEKYNFNENKCVNYTKMSIFSILGLIPSFLFCLLFWIVWILIEQPIIGIINPIMTLFFVILFTVFWSIAFNNIRIQMKLKNDIIIMGKKIGLKIDTIDEITKIIECNLKDVEKNKGIINEKFGVLKSNLSLDGNLEQVIIKTNQKLTRIEEEIDFNLKTKYKPDREEILDSQLKELREEVISLENDLKQHNFKLSDFSRRTSNLNFELFMNEKFNLLVENIDSLKVVIEKLEKFKAFIETRASSCRKALEIFDEILIEEKAKINQLFDEDSICIKFFNEITNGKYVDIKFDSVKGNIIVKKIDDEEISAYKLSEGTYDQLYLAIRVDLAQRILGEDKGFLIMDDIFLSYDTDRLKVGINILKKLSEMGWQIIYFTAKDKECELFKEITDNEIIRIEQI